jgi:hypothetical protein
MFEIIEPSILTNKLPGTANDEGNTKVVARHFSLWQVQALMVGDVQKAIIETSKEAKPSVGESFIGYIGNTYYKASIIVESTIKDVSTIHIDLSDMIPLWLAGNASSRSQRESLAKELGFNTWRQFTDHYLNHHGHQTFTGYVISW